MKAYKNLSGNSGILSYEASSDSIQIIFKSGRCRHYLYNQQSPGADIVDRMKFLAEQGRGLNSYISTTVRTRFSDKW